MTDKQPNLEPGIYPGVQPEVYHTWQAVSHSWLHQLSMSPAHLLDMLDGGPRESTPTQVLGSAIHCAVLEPDQFDQRYAIRPEGESGATKAGKLFKAESEAAGLEVITDKDGRLCQAIARRASNNTRVAAWLAGEHQTEVSLVWERDGYLCKARADLMVPTWSVLADLKTTITASQHGFAGQVARYHYHQQAAWYLDGIQRLTGRAWDFWFLPAEKRRPFLVSAQRLARDSAAHLMAVTRNDELFEQYKQCRDTRQWPGYPDVDEIELPEWALNETGTGTDEIEEPF